jgi:hypothetical protein
MELSPPQPVLYRAIRDKMYDKLTKTQLEQYGFHFDSDVFVYNDDKTQLNSIALNRYLFLPSQSFKEENGKVSKLSIERINSWCRLWGKIPSFLEIRESPGKGFGVFATQQILSGVFLGYYEGIRFPVTCDLVSNNYMFRCGDVTIDGQNLTYSNFLSLINDGIDPNGSSESKTNVAFLEYCQNMMAVTTCVIQPGDELLTSYGSAYWKGKLLDV